MVVLSGTVDNLRAKQAAEQDARNTVGVWRVKSYLKIRGTHLPSDQELVHNVKDALFRDPWEETHQIDVTVRDGIVHLRGTVDSEYEKTHAEDIASRIYGVTAVDNNLNVNFPGYTYYRWPYSPYYYTPDGSYYSNRSRALNQTLPGSSWPYATDDEMKAAIEDQLFWSPFVDADEVKVSVFHGVATLSGTVDNRKEFEAATENALEGGAHMVINNLKVK
jgi:osmotically-inducible protein OsmY